MDDPPFNIHHQNREARSPVTGGTVKFAVSIDESEFLLDDKTVVTAEESVSDRKTPLLVSVVSQDGGIGWWRGGYPDAIALSNKMEVTCERGHVFRAVATLSVSFWGRAYT